MGSTRGELKRKVLMGIANLTGEDQLMAEEAINMACRSIAEVQDFEELMVMDTTHAKTADGTKRYSWTTAWGLTRPKNIFSLVVHNDFESRKLNYKSPELFDEMYPYPEGVAEGMPLVYTRRGEYIELFPIPDAIYDLYIRYAQWPVELTLDTTQCSYSNIDSSIIALARDIFLSMRAGETITAMTNTKTYLGLAMDNDRSNPGAAPVARPFHCGEQVAMGEYWNNPFIRR